MNIVDSFVKEGQTPYTDAAPTSTKSLYYLSAHIGNYDDVIKNVLEAHSDQSVASFRRQAQQLHNEKITKKTISAIKCCLSAVYEQAGKRMVSDLRRTQPEQYQYFEEFFRELPMLIPAGLEWTQIPLANANQLVLLTYLRPYAYVWNHRNLHRRISDNLRIAMEEYRMKHKMLPWAVYRRIFV